MRLTLWFLVDVLAVHRATRLVAVDVLTQPIRERLIAWAYRRSDDALPPPMGGTARTHPTRWQEHAEDDPWAPKLATLVTCRWCSSAWIAAAVVAAERLVAGPWHYLAALLALSTASTLLARMEDR